MCLLASMHIKCQCQRRVHAYRLLVSMLVQMFSACMLTTYSAEMLFFRRAAAVSPPHKSLCGARLVCVVCTCGARLWFCNVHFLHIVHFVHIVHILHIFIAPPPPASTCTMQNANPELSTLLPFPGFHFCRPVYRSYAFLNCMYSFSCADTKTLRQSKMSLRFRNMAVFANKQ